ncbi:hypothetical protein HGRIS_007683 [Hohenbuehelia grisea]|uniref:AB hydrolase-1 domain-containing protein n=1 Tax=Hohenbuehelia grisea TaxID=104357 RepID=A0ABR3J601_9AGAR
MQSVAFSPMASSNPSPRPPRKTASFLSLRRQKDKDNDSLEISGRTDASGTDKKQTYFDVYPRPKTSPHPRQLKQKSRDFARRAATNPPSSSSNPDSPTSPSSYRNPFDSSGFSSPKTSYTFPSVEPADDVLSNIQLTPKSYSRTRSRTGPSGTSSTVPTLRFSGSSSTQFTETPPHTPVDSTSVDSSFESLPGLVAAPVAGVETMDALVDGMNGGADILGAASLASRARFGIPGHHPLYQPPLPTPPPGVVLGGGKTRRTKKVSHSSDSDREEAPASRPRRRRPRQPSSSRAGSNSTITPLAVANSSQSSSDDRPPSPTPVQESPPMRSVSAPRPATAPERRRSVVPSISEIIRNYAPPESQQRSQLPTSRGSSIYSHSHGGHGALLEETEPETPVAEEDPDIVSRSSIDSLADEIQQTMRNQEALKPAPIPPLQRSQSSYTKRLSMLSDNFSISSPRSDYGAPSFHSSSAASSQAPVSPLDTPSFLTLTQNTPSQAVAQYLRSTKLTTLLKLTRSPHASQDNPLTVSLSDLGSPTGIPVVVFLGLGCVRHMMGLYDEMAECLGLRLITIDRWGLGRTDQRPKSAKGIMTWASVVEEVLDLLHVGRCSVMAHSAGAPYALSFANKVPDRIIGDICLLAPWVGGTESGGYKWLKFVPNGIIKTAQAAEWKLQTWMIGKPPSLTYQGIGYNAQSTPGKGVKFNSPKAIFLTSDGNPRPSAASSSFSEYDDLGDFDGRFESRSTLEAQTGSENKMFSKRKPSRGFLNKLTGGGSGSRSQSPADDKPQLGKRLKSLRSVGSLRGKSSSSASKLSTPSLPAAPLSLRLEVGLGLEDISWPKLASDSSLTKSDGGQSTPEKFSSNAHLYSRANGRRSVSFTSSRAPSSLPSSPGPRSFDASYPLANGSGTSYQVSLGNALLAASHAESAKGTHSDLVQILNHENHSWGFSYASYPHRVRVWYGEKDEKIAENAVRWMERVMGERCTVNVVKGADHALMYKTAVVVEVLEAINASCNNPAVESDARCA